MHVILCIYLERGINSSIRDNSELLIHNFIIYYKCVQFLSNCLFVCTISGIVQIVVDRLSHWVISKLFNTTLSAHTSTESNT